MESLSNEEQKISVALRDKFSPEAIILTGSQVNGSATAASDWDVFIFCGKWRPDEQLDIDGLKVDANFAGWPSDGQYFDAGFGPVNPVRVLFDESGGKLQNLLLVTADAYQKGPRTIQPDECVFHMRSLGRNIAKLKKHAAEPEVQFYYKSKFYDFFIKVWFERQNKWAPSPALAIKTLSAEAPEVFELIQRFVSSTGSGVVEIAQQLADSSAS